MKYSEDILETLKRGPQTLKSLRMVLYQKYLQYFSQAAFCSDLIVLTYNGKVVDENGVFSLPNHEEEESHCSHADAEFGELDVEALQLQRDLLADAMDKLPLNGRLRGLLGMCDAMLKFYKEE